MKPQKAKCSPQALVPQKGRYNSEAGCFCGSRSRDPPMQQPSKEECRCPCRRVALPCSLAVAEGMKAIGRKTEQMQPNKGMNCSEERHRLYLENLTKQKEWGKSSVSCLPNDCASARRPSPSLLPPCPPAAVTSATCSCDQNLEHQQQGFCPDPRKMGAEYRRKMPYDILEDYQKKQDFLSSRPKDRSIQNICDDMRKKMKSHRETCSTAAQIPNAGFRTAAKKFQLLEPRLSGKPCTPDSKQSATCICPGKSKDAYGESSGNVGPCTDKTYEIEVKCPGKQPMECPENEAIFLRDACMKYMQKSSKMGAKLFICYDSSDIKQDIYAKEEDNCNCYSRGGQENAGKESCNVKEQNDICNENGIVNEGYDASSEEESFSCEEESFGHFSSMENMPGGSQSRFLEDFEESGEFISYRDKSNTQTGRSQKNDRNFSAAGYSQQRTACPQMKSPQRLQIAEQYPEDQRLSLPLRRKIFVDPAQFPNKSFLEQCRNRGPTTSTPCHPRQSLPSFNVSSIPQRSPHQQNDRLYVTQEEFQIGGNKFATSETRKRKTTQDDQRGQQEEASPAISGFKTLVDDETYLESTSPHTPIGNQIQDNYMEEQQQSPQKWCEPRRRPADHNQPEES